MAGLVSSTKNSDNNNMAYGSAVCADSCSRYFVGRVGRAEFLFGSVFSIFISLLITSVFTIILLFLVSGVVTSILAGLYVFNLNFLTIISFLFVAGFSTIISFSVFMSLYASFMTRRLHDISVSGWWTLAWFLIGITLPFIIAISTNIEIFGGYNLGFVLLFNIVIITIVLSLIPGDRGSNEYGLKPTKRSFWRYCICCKNK